MASLLSATDALAQGLAQDDVDTLPERLGTIQAILEDYRKSPFFAAEEKLLRVLLKHMATQSATAERLRRYPPVWDVLRMLFPLILLKPLAKALADRRFVRTLRQTLKEIAAPQQEADQTNGADSDVEMADAPALESPASPSPRPSPSPRKRKRPDAASFDLAIQRQAGGCLQTAEAVFHAVRVLLELCDGRSREEPLHIWVGAEHIKSMFYTSATESMALLVPWLSVCRLAVDRPKPKPLSEQSSWLSTFAALWELHMHLSGDISEVATHLFSPAARLLGRLTGVPHQTPLGIDKAVVDQWARDLRRFMARHFVLEARAAFQNRGGQEVLEVQTALSVSSPSAQITFPVLFGLVCRSRPESAGTAPSKDYETWVQAVFDAILHAAKDTSRDNGLVAVRTITEMAAERGTTLSASSLRTVCKDYAIRKNGIDWNLLLAIVKLNPDVFLVSDPGKQLLEQVLEAARDPGRLDAQDSDRAARFVVLLADGYAQARDLSGFVKLWLKHLAPDTPKSNLRPVWAQEALADEVAKLIQTSLTPTQLVAILDWLSSQTQPTESMARLHILEAVSRGISLDDFVDAANMKIFEGAFLEEFSKKELPAVSARRWMVASRAMARGTSDEARHVWSRIKSDIKRVLRKFPIEREDTFAAFKCCAEVWLAKFPGSAHEDEAATLICSFAERLENAGEPGELEPSDGRSSVSRWTYVSWILSDAPRLMRLLIARDSPIVNVILSLLDVSKGADPARVERALAVSRLLLEREPSVSNRRLMDLLIDRVLSMIDPSKSTRSGPSTKIAIQFLLDIPAEIPNRGQREAAMKSLVAHLTGDEGKGGAIGAEDCESVLSLMTKLMARPTYYEGMCFSHLASLGRWIAKIHERSNRRSHEELAMDDVSKIHDRFRLLFQLAVLSIRQMTSGGPDERERPYLQGAMSLLQSPCKDPDIVPRIVLLRAFISVVRDSPAAKKMNGSDGLDLASLQDRLLRLASPAVKSGNRNGDGLLTLLVALEALCDLDGEDVRLALSDAVPSLLEASDSLLKSRAHAGWEVRTFLATHFLDRLARPLEIKMAVAAPDATGDGQRSGPIKSAKALDKPALLRYVDAVVRSADEDRKLGYLEELLREDGDNQDALGCLLVSYRLIQHLKGSRLPEDIKQFGLAQAHYALCDRLEKATSPATFLLTSKAIHLLIDQNPACMTQFNIGRTLSCVLTVSARASTPALVAESPDVYPSLCRLVAMLIRRYRKRLEDSFHILVDTLQGLLRLLLSRPHEEAATAGPATATTQEETWARDARHFSRLLTLICEPAVGSGSTSAVQGSGGPRPAALDSEKDRARRFAGQFMYYVLMAYVRLQVEEHGAAAAVPHAVRAALEPGMFAIMDVTTRGGKGIMSAAMDASTRAVLREMYKRYERFGKWTGV
ncbi:a26e5adf-7a91-4cdb-8b32-c960c9e3783e [Thermothielavioides terrestris]|uniref:Nucleolar 27S pre-rRNA processing Urb2/Npa2 C-terminal domain-containing protein n=2 Tax=Thermothielavioides terrestris TaxID=2587410 RepID=G2RAY8_THETT|nr:uncharacterized protein THITE_2118856 [Thermothielavioides terrestris NRRL 8126]AEO68963.1 hypothetical protein THITE_2118856 [Thermothielavioides terrestris NRRL 8126]SPQ22764.1 a26e5adf-7a91-4cdb-8b32-c960c9e3783e [Thermothielavioides terrestris]